MKKIPSLFKRNYEGARLVYDEVVEGSDWVINGEGVPTVKFDGTACMIASGRIYKRYDAKNGKTPPEGFIPCQDPDPVSGHWPGWVVCSDKNPADKWFLAAYHNQPDGTYELIGEKINGNPYELKGHILVAHGADRIADFPRTFGAIRGFLSSSKIEGIVWHHPDGRMVKIKAKDFGFKWPAVGGKAQEKPHDY